MFLPQSLVFKKYHVLFMSVSMVIERGTSPFLTTASDHNRRESHISIERESSII